MAADVLVVDDEADIRELVAGILSDEGYAVRTANDSESALAAIRARKPSLLVLDIWMQGGGMDGLELLDMLRSLDADFPVIMISGHGNIETAVSAIKRGAYEFLEKPFKSDKLLLIVERALEATSLKRENRRLRAQANMGSARIASSHAASASSSRPRSSNPMVMSLWTTTFAGSFPTASANRRSASSAFPCRIKQIPRSVSSAACVGSSSMALRY